MKMNNKYFYATFLIIFLLILSTTSEAENPDTTLQKINKNIKLIKEASGKFNIDYKNLSSVIFVERTLNYNWEDDALDEILADAGLNSSIGFCQVKMKTAYWIEKQISDSTSTFYPGKNYENILNLSGSPKEIILKLENDSLNILYAAAYIKIMQNRWKNEGFPIGNKPQIIGTLYSTGLFHPNGEERKPNKNPKSNKFGNKVGEFIKLFKF